MILSRAEEIQFRRKISEAWDLRESPYFGDALEAFADWYDRIPLQRMERAEQLDLQIDELRQLLRETDPQALTSRRRAA